MREIVDFLRNNNGLYSATDITPTSIMARGNSRYIGYDNTSKLLFINTDGSTTSSNTPILIDNVKFTVTTNLNNVTILLITVTNGPYTLNTAYPINLR